MLEKRKALKNFIFSSGVRGVHCENRERNKGQEHQDEVKELYKEYIGMAKVYYEEVKRSKHGKSGIVGENCIGDAGNGRPQGDARMEDAEVEEGKPDKTQGKRRTNDRIKGTTASDFGTCRFSSINRKVSIVNNNSSISVSSLQQFVSLLNCIQTPLQNIWFRIPQSSEELCAAKGLTIRKDYSVSEMWDA
ncbi:hypothetical protein Tco_1311540 [Tanacetum coccineum]